MSTSTVESVVQKPQVYALKRTTNLVNTPILRNPKSEKVHNKVTWGQLGAVGIGVAGVVDFIRSYKEDDKSVWGTIVRPMLWAFATVGGLTLLKAPKNLFDVDLLNNSMLKICERVSKAFSSKSIFLNMFSDDFQNKVNTLARSMLHSAARSIKKLVPTPEQLEDSKDEALLHFSQALHEHEDPELGLKRIMQAAYKEPAPFAAFLMNHKLQVTEVLKALVDKDKGGLRGSLNSTDSCIREYVNEVLEPCGVSILKMYYDSKEDFVKLDIKTVDSFSSSETVSEVRFLVAAKPEMFALAAITLLKDLEDIREEEAVRDYLDSGKEMSDDELAKINKRVVHATLRFTTICSQEGGGIRAGRVEVDKKTGNKIGGIKSIPLHATDHASVKIQELKTEIGKVIQDISFDEDAESADDDVTDELTDEDFSDRRGADPADQPQRPSSSDKPTAVDSATKANPSTGEAFDLEGFRFLIFGNFRFVEVTGKKDPGYEIKFLPSSMNESSVTRLKACLIKAYAMQELDGFAKSQNIVTSKQNEFLEDAIIRVLEKEISSYKQWHRSGKVRINRGNDEKYGIIPEDLLKASYFKSIARDISGDGTVNDKVRELLSVLSEEQAAIIESQLS